MCSCDSYVLQLYEEPAAILQIQQSVPDSTSTVVIASPQSTGHSSISTSPNITNVYNNQGIVDGLSLHNLSQPQGCMMNVERTVSPTGTMSEVNSGKIPCQESVVNNEDKPSVSENTSKFGLNTRTVSSDVVPPCKVMVLQGVYAVRSPPLEVVKEESLATVSHLDSLSIADTTESDLVPDQFPLASASERLDGVLNPVIVSATNEVLISAAQDVNSDSNNSLLLVSSSRFTTDVNRSSRNCTENTKPHTLHCNVRDVPSPVILTEQRRNMYSSIHPVFGRQHKKGNCEQSVVPSSMVKEDEAVAGSCVSLPNIVEIVGSCDLLVTDSKCQELMNVTLPTQNVSRTVSQSSSGSAVSVISSVNSPILSSVVSSSMMNKSVQKVPETQNKQHESESATHVERRTANCISETESSPNTPSVTEISKLKSQSVLKNSSVSLLANSHKPKTSSKATDSAFSCVKAVVVHEVSLPELSAARKTQALMSSKSQSVSADDEVTPVNTNSHTGGSSLLRSGAKASENKEKLHVILNEDMTCSFEKFLEEQQSSIIEVNFPETRSTSTTDLLRLSGSECKDTKGRVPTKAAVGTRQRKLATTCPPNISSFTKTVSKTVPPSADSKKVQCSESLCKSGGSDFTRGEAIKIKSKVKK
jgi:hypothetical protein